MHTQIKIVKQFSLLLLLVANTALLGQDNGDYFGDTPANPNPLIYDHHVDAYTYQAGQAYQKDVQRTGIDSSDYIECSLCGKKETLTNKGGFGVVVVDTSWSIKIPTIDPIKGGDPKSSINLNTRFDCTSCANTRLPIYEYSKKVTMAVPYTITKIATYSSSYNSQTMDVPYPLPVSKEETASYNTKELGHGAVEDLGCSQQSQCTPCN